MTRQVDNQCLNTLLCRTRLFQNNEKSCSRKTGLLCGLCNRHHHHCFIGGMILSSGTCILLQGLQTVLLLGIKHIYCMVCLVESLHFHGKQNSSTFLIQRSVIERVSEEKVAEGQSKSMPCAIFAPRCYLPCRKQGVIPNFSFRSQLLLLYSPRVA